MAERVWDVQRLKDSLINKDYSSEPLESRKIVGWKCKKCENVWRESICKRATFEDCPNCSPDFKRSAKSSLDTAQISEEMCQICCENMTQAVRCPYCEYICCKLCLQTYILGGIGEASCMNEPCRKYFTLSDLKKMFGKAWVSSDREGTYGEFRCRSLIEAERAKIPETMSLLPLYRKRERFIRKHQDLRKENEDAVKRVVYLKNRKKLSLEEKIELETLEPRLDEYQTLIEESKARYMAAIDLLGGTTPEKQKIYLQGCPQEECRGLINSKGRCEVCDHRICKKCRETLTKKHVCDPNTVATVKKLVSTTKNCPSCHTPIYRIEGCDQMFCTSCHTAFSWSTGRVETGIVHNPHYFEWQRSISTNGEIPRTPGDDPCGGAPNYEYLRRVSHLIDKQSQILGHMFDFVGDRRVRSIQNQIEDCQNILKEYRYRFVIQDLTEGEWIKRIKTQNHNINTLSFHQRIFESLGAILTEILNQFQMDVSATVSRKKRRIVSKRFWEEMERVRLFINEVFLQEGHRNCFTPSEIPSINPFWIRFTHAQFLRGTDHCSCESDEDLE